MTIDLTEFFYGAKSNRPLPTVKTGYPGSRYTAYTDIKDSWLYAALSDKAKANISTGNYHWTKLITMEHLYDRVLVPTSSFYPFMFACADMDDIVVRPGPLNPRAMDANVKKMMRKISHKSYAELLQLASGPTFFDSHYLIHRDGWEPIYASVTTSQISVDDHNFQFNAGFKEYVKIVNQELMQMTRPSVALAAFDGRTL